MSEQNGVDAPKARPDFSKLKRLAVDGKERWCKLPFTGRDTALRGRIAGPWNPHWNNSRIATSDGKADEVAEADAISLRNARFLELDYSIFANHVLTGWRGVVDFDDAEVEFTPENAEDFLRALPPYLFNLVRLFFCTPTNFFGDEEEKRKAELLGNSDAGSSGASSSAATAASSPT